MNHKRELKQDRGVMENPVDLNGFIIDSEESLGVNLNIKPEL